MSSGPASERSWSLTRRMAWTTALSTCLLLALGAAWSAYFVLHMVRSDLASFTEHELSELALGIEQTDGSAASVQPLVDRIAEVSQEPECAFRVRDAEGVVLGQGGSPRLLTALTDAIEPGGSWREYLFSKKTAVGAQRIHGHDLVVELLIDTSEVQARMLRYLCSIGAAFLVSAGLAGLLAWFTTHRGLRSLREVVDQARALDLHSGGGRLSLEGAPTEVREVGVELDALIARIDDGLEQMRTFTASLAHELRSPLQNLISETEVALMSELSPREHVAVLRSNLEDLLDLSDAIDHLVAHCRTSEPNGEQQGRESFDLAEEVELRMGRERRAAGRLGVGLEIGKSGDTGLRADREGCLRVVRNLLANAIAHTPEGGLVRLTLEGAPDEVRIVVEDEGPGIPEEVAECLFEPFVSGPPEPGRRRGYGLGLSICRAVMEAHAGSIEFASRKPRGTRFVAVFPRGPGEGRG